jgi:hypothetical protein
VSGYIEAGYVVALGSLGTYALSLVTRERAARRRLPPPQAAPEALRPQGPDASGTPS